MSKPLVASLVVALALPLAACSDSPTSTPDAPPSADAAPSDGANGFATCDGACRTTNLTATFGATTRQLDLAYFGVTRTASGATLHVEAYAGATAGCPVKGSPTPDCTLVLGRVPVPSDATPSTSPGNLLDYGCELLTGLGAAATMVTITPVAADVCTTCVGMPAPSQPAGLVALDVELTFAGGTISGHLFASHCDSLDVTD